ncbi:hypothetical protein IWQ60_005500 [Tieghemiomyces parasiticus]|uniref:Uncharacterized protein n=1 Tax=Tieghemiomyces parasiticus TaxID=78921 RepID=A0A9W8DYU2_9FUNG|nr:hypothetical protein IWQ60_005500 [Tieghemiomyces parasiticus]
MRRGIAAGSVAPRHRLLYVIYRGNFDTDTELRHELVFNFGTDRCEDLAVRIARHSYSFGGMSLTQPVQAVDYFTTQMDKAVRSLNYKYSHKTR